VISRGPRNRLDIYISGMEKKRSRLRREPCARRSVRCCATGRVLCESSLKRGGSAQ
jgi:hypothetical protein